MVAFSVTFRRIKQIAAAACVAVALPAAASAIPLTTVASTTTINVNTNGGSSSAATSTVFETSNQAAFTFSNTGGGRNAIIYQAFTVTTPYNFNIVLTDYFANRPNGTELTVLEGHRTSGDASSIFALSSQIVRVTDIGTTLINLTSGDYTIRFAEFGPENFGDGEVTFEAVPLPAGAGLLVTALGGLVVIRRRRKAAAQA